MTKREGIQITMLLILLGLISSCAVVFMPYSPAGSNWPGQVFYDRNYSLPQGGTIELSIVGVETEVEIIGQKKDKARIIASQSLPFYRRGMMVTGLRQDAPQVDVEKMESSLRIKVEGRKKTIFPVKIELQVPREVQLELIRLEQGDLFIHDLFGLIVVSLEKGNLKMNNISGSVEASIIEGNIEAEVLDLRDEDTIRLRTEEGNIALFLEPEVRAKVEAEAPGGGILCEFHLEEVPEKQLKTVLNEGQATIILRTSKGNIELKKTE